MFKAQRRRLLLLVRRFLGVVQLGRLGEKGIDLAETAHLAHLAHINQCTWGHSSPDEIQASIIYQRAQKIVSALSPKNLSNARYVRVGRNFDGGYVMVDHFPQELSAAYSFGINDDVSWDLQIAERGIPVYLYDHTIPALPQQHPGFHFSRKGICGHKKAANLVTLSECLQQYGHTDAEALLLKMDVEGYEWDVFSECAPELLAKFQQIVVEYHGLTLAAYQKGRCDETIKVLEKLNVTHQVVHVHANGISTVLAMKRLVLPDLLEVTYVRRSDFAHRLVNDQRVFPTDLDEPTFESAPDIYLGRFNGEL